MFVLAILIGIYAYLIFLLGLWAQLRNINILALTVLFVIAVSLNLYQDFTFYKRSWRLPSFTEHRIGYVLWSLFIIQAIVNFLGVLSPELAFDALWYHLTFPKLYLAQQTISYIPGGLLYYATMPKFTELLYIPSLVLGGETAAQFVHFMFGILTSIVLYQISRRYLPNIYAVCAVVIFYSSLVVAWESTTAYIDLARAFFEILALSALLLYTEEQKKYYLVVLGVLLGLAISVKLLALGSVFIVLCILLSFLYSQKRSSSSICQSLGIVTVLALLIPLPWFIFGFIYTGNPVYPFLSPQYPSGLSSELLSPILFIQDMIGLFLYSPDPINPVYLIFLPVVFFIYRYLPKPLQIVAWYSLLSLLVWYVTPRTGGGRFILPYLPAYSLLVAAVLTYWSQKRSFTAMSMMFVSMGVLIIVAVSTIFYRTVATVPAFPYLVGRESKQEYLSRRLNYGFGEFYDTDGFFKKTITPGDTVLLYGFHNLYYADFRFIHESVVKPGDKFTYIAVQKGILPERFRNYRLVHTNLRTGVQVYSNNGEVAVF